jgi:Uma2 family endonuclease
VTPEKGLGRSSLEFVPSVTLAAIENDARGSTMDAKKLPTIDDWLADDCDERADMIEGETVYKARPSAEHSFSAQALSAALNPFVSLKGGSGGGGAGGWWIGVEAHVLYHGGPNGFIHELAGWRRDRHAERPKGNRITARPNWVCEILSSNRSDDLVKKKRVLDEQSVEHYWLVDVRDGVLSAMRWVEGGYLIVQEATAEEVVRIETFDEVELDVGVLLGTKET